MIKEEELVIGLGEMMNYPGVIYHNKVVHEKIDAFKDNVYLINTVHDSIVLDVHKSVIMEVASTLKKIMENGGEYLKESFDIEFDLPLKAEISVGPNWGELEKLDI